MTGSSDMVMSVDNERKWTVPPVKEGNFPVPDCWVMQNVRPLKDVCFIFCLLHMNLSTSVRAVQLASSF